MGQTNKIKYTVEFNAQQASKNAEKLAKDIKQVSTTAKATGAALTVALTPFMYIGKKAVAQAEEFQKSVAKIRTATGATGAALNSLVDNFKAIRKAVPQGDELVAQTLGAVNQKFSVTGKTLETVTKNILDFSRMTGTDAANSVTAIGKAMNNWKIEAKDTSKFLDKVYTASTKTGASAESIATYMASMGAQFRNLNLNLDQSIALIAAFSKAGVSVNSVAFPMTKAIGEMSKAGIKDLGAGFADLIKKIKEAGSTAEANAIGKKFFGGRGYMQITTAIREGRFEIDELIKSLQNSGGSFDKAADATLTFGDRLQRFKQNAANALEPLGLALIKIADQYMPAAQATLQAFAEHLTADKLKAVAYAGAIMGIGYAATKAVKGMSEMVKAMATIKAFLMANPEVLAVIAAAATGATIGKAIASIPEQKQKQQTQDAMLKAVKSKEPNWGNSLVMRTGHNQKKAETLEEAYNRLFPAKQTWTYNPSIAKTGTSGAVNPFTSGLGTTDFSKVGAKSQKAVTDYTGKIAKLKDEIDRLNNTSNYDSIIAQMDKYATKLNELGDIDTKSSKKNYEAWQAKKDYTAKFSTELSAAISDINLALEKNDITIETAYNKLATIGERFKLSGADAYTLEKALRSLKEQMNENTQSILELDRAAAEFSQENLLNNWANKYNAETAFGGAASVETAKAYLAVLEQTWASVERGSSAWVTLGEKIREVQQATLTVDQQNVMGQYKQSMTDMRGLTSNFALGFADAITGAIRGTESFSDAIKNLLQDMGAMIVKAMLMKAIMGVFGLATGGGLFGSSVPVVESSWKHCGGIVGDGNVTKKAFLPLSTFTHAPRLHSGNLRADEYPAILQKGETVIPKNAHFGSVATEGAGAENHYNITIQAVDSKSFTDMLTRNNGGLESLIVNSLNRGGALRSAIRGATA